MTLESRPYQSPRWLAFVESLRVMRGESDQVRRGMLYRRALVALRPEIAASFLALDLSF